MTTIPDSANGLLVTAPESVRDRYRGLRGGDRMNGLAECRPAGGLVERSAPAALKSTAKAWKALKRQLCFVKFLWAVSAFLLVRLSGCF